eukprot:2301945-Ditylum_brightwellii.AAC.1
MQSQGSCCTENHKNGRERGTKGELTSLLRCQFPIPPATTTPTKMDPTVDPRERCAPQRSTEDPKLG